MSCRQITYPRPSRSIHRQGRVGATRPGRVRASHHLLQVPRTVLSWMRRWLADLGHDSNRDERAASAV